MSSSLADAIFWICAACCSIAQLAIVRSVIRSPARAAPSDAASPSAAPATRRIAELAWAVLPGILLALVLVWTWHAMHGGHDATGTVVLGGWR